VLFKVDIHSLLPNFVRTLLVAGFGLAFILHGANWFHDITQSFIDIGKKASHIASITPSSILIDGLSVATNLINSINKIGNTIHAGMIGDLFVNAGLLMIVGLFAILILLAFAVVAAEFITIQVLMFIMFGVGVIMLGFSAFRPVASFAEKYFSAAIAIGTRLMVLYVIVGIGMGLAASWPAEVTASPNITTVLIVLGQATIFGYLAVRIPSLAAGLLQGALNTGGGDFIAAGVGAGMGMVGGAALATETVGSPVIAAVRGGGVATGRGVASMMGTASGATGPTTAPRTKIPEGVGYGASSPSTVSASQVKTQTPESSGGSTDMPPPGNPKGIHPRFDMTGSPEAQPKGKAGGRGGVSISSLHHATAPVNTAVDKTPTQGISPRFDTPRDD
jgi:type IV secretion system protein TrbL